MLFVVQHRLCTYTIDGPCQRSSTTLYGFHSNSVFMTSSLAYMLSSEDAHIIYAIYIVLVYSNVPSYSSPKILLCSTFSHCVTFFCVRFFIEIHDFTQSLYTRIKNCYIQTGILVSYGSTSLLWKTSRNEKKLQ